MSTPRPWNPPWWLGLLWGFAEGTFFFIIPDVILSWASLVSFKGGCRMLVSVLAGSLLGGLVMYEWASSYPAPSRAAVSAVPFVRPRMFDAVQADYRQRGISGLLQGPGSGIPYKIYAVLAPPVAPLPSFLATSILARLERLALGWLLCSALGVVFSRQIARHQRAAFALFTLVWIGIYATYWGSILLKP